jgi:hypothetical protein
MESIYAAGKSKSEIAAPFRGTNQLFASQKLDGRELTKLKYEHCVFVNISFMECNLSSGNFLDCFFIACYFKKAHISATYFTGCRFIDCRFPRIRLSSCAFRYSTFQECVMPYEEIADNLPSEQNLREDLCRSLYNEAKNLGMWSQARKYRLEELRSYENNLLNIVKAQSAWYKEHYDGLQRVEAFIKYCICVLNRLLWGHGEKVRSLAINYVILMIIIFPVIYLQSVRGLPDLNGFHPGFLDCIKFSIRNSVSMAAVEWMRPDSGAVWCLISLQPFVSAIFASLFASYVFRYISR